MGRTLNHSLDLLPFQKMFLESKEKNLWLAAGLGTGKTYIACLYVIRRLLLEPDGFGLLTASTYKQLNNSILAQLFALCDQLGLKFKFNKQDSIFTLKATGARVMCVSADSYEQLRGIEFSYAVLEEACLYPREAYDVIIGRIRKKSKLPLEIRLISTPKGFNWTYEAYAEGLGEIPFGKIVKRNKHAAILRARSSDNFFLPDGYIETLAANYSTKVFLQEVEAEFVAGGAGAVYCDFIRSEHTYDLTDRGGDLYVGMDFNNNPMTAVVANKVEVNGQTILEVFDEFYLENSNTEAMCKEIRKRYPNRKIIVSPDATGSANKTCSTKSDHAILREHGFIIQLLHNFNPHKMDRYNCLNKRLTERRFKIGKNCKKLIRDLEQVSFEKNPLHLTHISDAAGYLAWRWMKLVSPKKQSQTLNLG